MNKNLKSKRMMVYAWCDTQQDEPEVKFGEYFIDTDTMSEEAIFCTLRYMRCQFHRRERYFDSPAVRKIVWDVSDIAKANGLFYNHSHVDDLIRTCIPGKIGRMGCEFHDASFDDLVKAVFGYIDTNRKVSTRRANRFQEVIAVQYRPDGRTK